MVLRVRPTPTRFLTNSLYTPVDNTPMHSKTSVCHPWGFSICIPPYCVLLLGRGEAVVLGASDICLDSKLVYERKHPQRFDIAVSFRDRAVRGKSASIVIGFKVVT